MGYGVLIFYGAVTVILASVACFFILIAYDSRKYPYCQLCKNNAHTYRHGIFNKNFHCSEHGIMTN